MLTDDETADAYAHVCEAINIWDSVLNIIYDAFSEEDMGYVMDVGKHLEMAKEVLEP